MRYGNAEAFRAALEQRLRNQSSASDASLIRLRKHVSFERLLARLAVVAPGRWVLKGAYALDLRFGSGTRATKDVDLSWRAEEGEVTSRLVAAAGTDLDDFFSLRAERTSRLEGPVMLTTVRYAVTCELAGRQFDVFPLDVTLSPMADLRPTHLRLPGSLGFAGIEGPELLLLALEQQLAEKVHAYSGRYGIRQKESTRTKDLIDLVLISGKEEIDAAALRQALKTTFAFRASQAVPPFLPPPPRSWAVAYARIARDVGLPPDLSGGHTEAANFLDPILTGAIAKGRWTPIGRRWE